MVCNMKKLTVIRKRLIPFEEVDISKDEQLYLDTVPVLRALEIEKHSPFSIMRLSSRTANGDKDASFCSSVPSRSER